MSGPYLHTFYHACHACEAMSLDGLRVEFIDAQHRVQLWRALADHHKHVAGEILVSMQMGNYAEFTISDAVDHAKLAARARQRVGEAAERLRST